MGKIVNRILGLHNPWRMVQKLYILGSKNNFVKTLMCIFLLLQAYRDISVTY
ncbi:hypothetical protein C1645_881981 [Glomus cerebriforme]|uniref:Uncharacterized protein n=1 Tax=Glomus cerebriforme TaxID=658196 RepID=A0A397S8W9_9GLOM|nr:hypothetical protein C1645_881981 [Glomus cerebriforme]